MMDDDDAVGQKSEIGTGEDLSAMSVEELGRRISLFQAEISRHEAEIASKQSSKDAAESFFKKP